MSAVWQRHISEHERVCILPVAMCGAVFHARGLRAKLKRLPVSVLLIVEENSINTSSLAVKDMILFL